MSSTLSVGIKTVINLASGHVIFPEAQEDTEDVAKALHIHFPSVSHATGMRPFNASDVFERRSKAFLGISGQIIKLKEELGDDLTKICKRKEAYLQKWLQRLQEEHGFPSEVSIPCI